ncbi:MAG: hypothetical protein ABJ239_05600 [Erythrobacter sp.]
MVADRRLRTNEKPNRAILLSWIAVSIVLLLMTGPYVLEGRYPGPDDSLRLVQVRDLLAGQGWYDLHQYRITPPDGTLMHWSRLVDAPIAALIWLLSFFFEQSLAERIAMVITPLLILLLIMVAIGRLAWRMFDTQIAIFACLVLAALPPIVMQTQPLRIDHHAWQIFAVALSAWALSWRSPFKGGAAAGIAMGLGMMISLETLPMSAAFALVLGLRWMRSDKERWWLVSYMQALAGSLVLGFAATRGWADLAPHCDVISPAHLGLFLITALATGAFAAVPSMPRVVLVIGMAAAGALGVAFMAWSTPQCIGNPFTDLDPLVRQHWYESVLEGRPIWLGNVDAWLPAIIQSVTALVVALRLGLKGRDWARVWWFEYALLLGLAILGGILTARSIAFASALSAIPLAWLLNRIFKYWKTSSEIGPKLVAALAIYAIFLSAGPLKLAREQLAPLTSSDGVVTTTRESKCEIRENAPLLNQLKPSTVFAPLDIGPALLLNSHHSVVASGHHRAQPAMRDVIVAFTSTPEQARPIIVGRDADYIVACIDLTEASNLAAGGGKASLMHQLMNGNAPEWLEIVEVGGPDELKVWKFGSLPIAGQNPVAPLSEASMPDSPAPAVTPE